MAVGTADYTMKNLNEKTNEEIEGFLKTVSYTHLTLPTKLEV